ncbi:MAG: SDR family oxidoreductase [Kofleriaceae bacterium]|nr:SDR family oxidoreductase [Kofleriaceae bacterium]
MQRLREHYGPWALITGASDGIGRAFAHELAAAGVHVVLVARRGDVLEALARELRTAHGVEVRVVAADLAQADGVARTVEAIADLDLGLFVAAAGYGTSGDFIGADLAVELAMIDVNCRAVAALTQPIGRKLVERGRGGLVFMSSLVAFQGAPRAANYAATKAYIQTLAEGLAIELRGTGVDVLAVAPGPVQSGFASRADMKMSVTDSPATVARGALHALGHRTTTRPGRWSKLLAWSLATLPRWGRVQVMSKVMHGMTRHQQLPREGHPWATHTLPPAP